jgi:NhaA family Na+:H+ antiporter
VYGISAVLLKLKLVVLPDGMNKTHLLGGAFLAAIGFTMSLFIAGLAFTDIHMLEQAKMGAIFSSLTASIIGFLLIKKACKQVECG